MEKKNLVVDKNTCIGCGTCVALVPEVFELGEDGKSRAKQKNQKTAFRRNPAKWAKLKNEIEEAIEACPVGAISYEQ